MKLRELILASVLVLSFAAVSFAADFDWLQDLNIKAEADLSGFKAKLSARFKIGDAQVSTVVSNVSQPADAYMVLRLAEMSKNPPEQVVKEYKGKKNKGWGVLAKSLGIKPGSKEFHELKKGHDLQTDEQPKEKGNAKGRGKGKH